MRCPKCKKPLREGAKFCPTCGARAEKRKVIRITYILIVVILLSIVAIGGVGGILLAKNFVGRGFFDIFTSKKTVKVLDDDHAVVIQNDLEVFSGGDIAEIAERVFGSSSDKISANESSNGIIADLFANAEVQISSADESTIIYTIVSPDISDFFTAYADQLDSITTSEELGQAILEYAKMAPTKEFTVTVPYTVSEDGIDVAYDDPDFINAMTGGLLDAYSALYDLYLSEG